MFNSSNYFIIFLNNFVLCSVMYPHIIIQKCVSAQINTCIINDSSMNSWIHQRVPSQLMEKSTSCTIINIMKIIFGANRVKTFKVPLISWCDYQFMYTFFCCCYFRGKLKKNHLMCEWNFAEYSFLCSTTFEAIIQQLLYIPLKIYYSMTIISNNNNYSTNYEKNCNLVPTVYRSFEFYFFFRYQNNFAFSITTEMYSKRLQVFMLEFLSSYRNLF